MAELFAPTIQDQIACITRELAMRRAVYPRRVADRKMSQAQADRGIVAMEAVLATLERVRDASD